MAGPENNEKLEALAAKPMQLPRADQAALIGTQGAVQLPARPPDQVTKDNDLDSEEARKKLENRIQQAENKDLERHLQKARSDDVRILVETSQLQDLKILTRTLFAGAGLGKEILALFESFLESKSNLGALTTLIKLATDGSLEQQSAAQNLLNLLPHLRGFDLSVQDIGMLDSLENQLTQILRYLNPNTRLQQQQQAQEDNAPDDDAASAGPEKVEDDLESSSDGPEEADLDTDYSPSPRSKKGKAKSRSRSRRSRFRKWLARMMRVFSGKGLVMPTVAKPQIAKAIQDRERRFVVTVRIFGRVIDARTKAGISAVKIISTSLGTVETSEDGSYAFENVTEGLSYSLVAIKSGYSFRPLSVNDIALNSREHNFYLEED